MSYETLMIEKKDRVCLVTINRPDKLNALNATSKNELRDIFEKLATDDEVDVVILTGSGEKSFVAGTDIGELTALEEQSGKEFAAGGQQVFDRIENLGKPVIAAVNGYALGGGLEIALACHIRLAADSARFGQPEVNLGIIPGYGGTQRLARLIGEAKAMELILTGDPIKADEAYRLGLVNAVFPASELLDRAKEMAGKIASKGQVAIRLAVKAVHAVQESHLADGLEKEAQLFGQCCATEDFKEGARAFLEKRNPIFKGK